MDFLLESLDTYEDSLLWSLAEGLTGSYDYIPSYRTRDYAAKAQQAVVDAIDAAGGTVAVTDAAQTEALEAALLKDSALNAVMFYAAGAVNNMRSALGDSAFPLNNNDLYLAYEIAAGKSINEWAAGGGFKGETTYNLTIPIGNIGEIKMTLKNNDGTVSVPFNTVNFTAYSGTGQ